MNPYLWDQHQNHQSQWKDSRELFSPPENTTTTWIKDKKSNNKWGNNERSRCSAYFERQKSKLLCSSSDALQWSWSLSTSRYVSHCTFGITTGGYCQIYQWRIFQICQLLHKVFPPDELGVLGSSQLVNKEWSGVQNYCGFKKPAK